MGYVSAKRKFLICLVKQTQTSHLPNFCQNQTWWALTSSLLIINISIVRYIISVLVAYHLNQNVPLRRAISQHFRISDQLLCKKKTTDRVSALDVGPQEEPMFSRPTTSIMPICRQFFKGTFTKENERSCCQMQKNAIKSCLNVYT